MFDSEPFGQRAVRLGMATSEQVREALETQKMLSEKAGLIGEILVEMGWLDPESYIEIVQELLEEDGQKSHDEVQDVFIERALARKCVQPSHIEQARKIQSGWMRKSKLIGQLMVEMGYLTSSQLERIVSTYKNDGQKQS